MKHFSIFVDRILWYFCLLLVDFVCIPNLHEALMNEWMGKGVFRMSTLMGKEKKTSAFSVNIYIDTKKAIKLFPNAFARSSDFIDEESVHKMNCHTKI